MEFDTFQRKSVNFDVDEISSLICDQKSSRHALQYEKVIIACGFGRFQKLLLVVCGLAFVSDAVEIQVASFILPAACDLEMTSVEKGWLNAVIFVGMMIGGYAFGGIADIKGRRSVLICSLAMNGTFGMASAFMPTFAWFVGFRFLSGVGVGAALPVLFTYFAEFLSRDYRGPMIGMLASFLMIGNILTSALAWLIIPTDLIVFYSWRLFVAVSSIPALTSAFIFYFAPESPKFLLENGDVEKAKSVFIMMYQINCKSKEMSIPKNILQCTFLDENNFNRNKASDIVGSISEIFKATVSLFEKRAKYTTVVLMIIWFTLSFSYYGLCMWLPEIFKSFQHGGSFCSNNVSQNLIVKSTDINATNNTTQRLFACDHVDQQAYLQAFLVALSNLPGNVFTIVAIDKVGRRNLFGVSLFLSGVTVFFFQLLVTRAEITLMACIFSGFSVIAWNVLNAVALENYPTHLRSTAFGLQTSMGRIASILSNIVFGALLDVQCWIPLLLVSGFLLVGAIAVFRLPKTDDKILS